MKLTANTQHKIAFEMMFVTILVIAAMIVSAFDCYFLKTDFMEGTMFFSGVFLVFFYFIRGIVLTFADTNYFNTRRL